MIVSIMTLVLATLFQLIALRGLSPAGLVGDEREYADPEPFGKSRALWLRVPMHGWIVRLADKVTGGAAGRGGRLFNCLCTVAATTIATGYVEQTHGGAAATISAALLLLSTERIVMAIHLWPDSFLSLLVLLFALLLVNLTSANAPLLAVVAVIAFSVRVDTAPLIVLTLLTSAFVLPDPALNVPAIVGFGVGALCLRSRILFGSWLPDTTLSFNLAVAHREVFRPKATVRSLMQQTIREQQVQAIAPKELKVPITRYLANYLVRLKTILGQETFISQNLIPNKRIGYINAKVISPPSPLSRLLAHGFSVQILLLLATWEHADAGLLGLFWAMVFTYSIIVARSRYRVALIPLQAMIAGPALVDTVDGIVAGRGFSPISALLVVVFIVFLVLVPVRREL